MKLPSGGTAPVEVFVPSARLGNDVQLALNEPPEGIAIQKVLRSGDGLSVVLSADASKVKAGLRGNLIVDAFTERAATKSQAPRGPGDTAGDSVRNCGAVSYLSLSPD